MVFHGHRLWHKGPANPPQAMCSPGKAIGLRLPSPPLLQLQGEVSALPCCPCSRSKEGKPLQEAEGMSSDHRDTDSSPDLTHNLPKVTLRLPAPGSCPLCSLGLSKKEQKLVKVVR